MDPYVFTISVLSVSLALAAPVILAALGGLVCIHSGWKI